MRCLKPVLLFLLPFLVILPLTHPGGWQPGLRLGAVIAIKGLAMVQTVFPMFGTTPFHVSIKALARLRLPERLRRQDVQQRHRRVRRESVRERRGVHRSGE